MKWIRCDEIKSYKKCQYYLCFILLIVNQKEFYGVRVFCFKEKNSVNRRVDCIFIDIELIIYDQIGYQLKQ